MLVQLPNQMWIETSNVIAVYAVADHVHVTTLGNTTFTVEISSRVDRADVTAVKREVSLLLTDVVQIIQGRPGPRYIPSLSGHEGITSTWLNEDSPRAVHDVGDSLKSEHGTTPPDTARAADSSN